MGPADQQDGMAAPPASPIGLRPATQDDVTFVAQVYGRAMGPVLRATGLDLAQQAELLLAQWDLAEICIIRAVGRDVGWLQVAATLDGRFIRNFCIDAGWQKLGIGSSVLRTLMAEAARHHHALTLGVARHNPARRLYERFGFRVTHDDTHHLYMRWEP